MEKKLKLENMSIDTRNERILTLYENEVRTLRDVTRLVKPFFDRHPALDLDTLHTYRADKSRQRLQLYLDQPLMHPRRLRCVARAMRHATDLDVVFVQQIS